MGNICRSSAAEGIFTRLAADAGRLAEFDIDSAGTINYHSGEPADDRMRAAAARRGYSLDGRARQINAADYDGFDLIVTMDDDNFQIVTARHSGGNARIVRMCEYCTAHSETEVPDPYYGGEAGFDQVLDILEDACANLLQQS